MINDEVKENSTVYCSLAASALRRSNLAAAAFPRMMVEVGMVRAEPEAAVKAKPPAVVKEAAVMGAKRKTGEGAALVLERRQAAMAKTIKP